MTLIFNGLMSRIKTILSFQSATPPVVGLQIKSVLERQLSQNHRVAAEIIYLTHALNRGLGFRQKCERIHKCVISQIGEVTKKYKDSK